MVKRKEKEIVSRLECMEERYRGFNTVHQLFLDMASRLRNQRCSPSTDHLFFIAEVHYNQMKSIANATESPHKLMNDALAQARRDYPNITDYINKDRSK